MTTPSKFRNVPKVNMDEIMTVCLVLVCADRRWRSLCVHPWGGGGQHWDHGLHGGHQKYEMDDLRGNHAIEFKGGCTTVQTSCICFSHCLPLAHYFLYSPPAPIFKNI